MSRTISVGYETVMDRNATLELAEFLSGLDIDGIAVSAGRADWTTFRWEGHEESWCFREDFPDEDPFLKAIEILNPTGKLKVTAVVDVFVNRSTATRSVTPNGNIVGGQVSLTELASYEPRSHGSALTKMCGALAELSRVDAINITELQYDDGGFGNDDLATFKAGMDVTDWPRLLSGSINCLHPFVVEWRTCMVSSFVGRVSAACRARDKELIVDVRAPKFDFDAVRNYGQDYLRLLDVGASKLGIWYFIGSSGSDGVHSIKQTLQNLRVIHPERVTVEVGLWGENDEAMGPEMLVTALKEVERAGFDDVWVLPSSLFTPAIKKTLAALWGR